MDPDPKSSCAPNLAAMEGYALLLQQGVKAGIITEHQYTALIGLRRQDDGDSAEKYVESVRGVSLTSQDASAFDREIASMSDHNLRFVGGANDLFITVGISLLLLGAGFILQSQGVGAIATALTFMGSAWLIGEYVTRLRRLKLASALAALAFVGSVMAWSTLWLGEKVQALAARTNDIFVLLDARSLAAAEGSIAIGVISASAAIYFLRFKVPILSGVLALCFTSLAFLWTSILYYDGIMAGRQALPAADTFPKLLESALYVPLICGIITFGVGIVLDLKDRERFTIWSDCAFWLHVVSAPLLVHPLFILATGQEVVFGRIEPDSTALVMLAILIAAFTLMALTIDRRSLLVPTFAYFGALGVFTMVNETAQNAGLPGFAIALMAIGVAVLFFGAAWQQLRGLIVAPMLPKWMLEKLPPIKV